MNLAELLLEPAREMPDAAALVHEGTVVTYGELAEQSGRMARRFVDDGVQPGDRVAIVAPCEPRFVAAYLGALRAGSVVVPLNPEAPAAELERDLASVEATLVVRDLSVPVTGEAPGTVPRDDDDLAVLLFTAGTAGAPKAAMLTHGNLVTNLGQIQGHPSLALRPEDVGLCVLPLFHVYGLHVGIGVALAAGASVVLDRFDAARSVRLVREHGVTVVAAVPAMWSAWLELADADAPPDSFSTVRLAVSGAAALSEETASAMRERFGVVVAEGYGLTEASAVVTAALVANRPPQPGSIGLPLPGVDVRLVDVDGADVLAGDPGEIWVRGPNVFPGYWRDEEATKRVLTADGWLRTGDVAVADDDGELTLVDRAKDLVIVSGFNVYPAEVEEVLLAHPDVAEAAVVGEPDDRSGEAVAAYVVAEPGRAPTTDELSAHCTAALARYKCPTRVEIVDVLPRSFVGKLLRRELRRS